MKIDRRTLVIALTLAVGAVAWPLAQLIADAAYHFRPGRAGDEAGRLQQLLALKAGDVVAEIGAGGGELSLELARRLGASSTVFATELDPAKLAALRKLGSPAGSARLAIVGAAAADTNLPDACCDAAVMRNVYHHVGEPAAFTASVARAIRPGGRVAVMDFEPGAFFHLWSAPAGTAKKRSGHGVTRADMIEEFSSAGFEMVQAIDNWGGRMYAVLFTRRVIS